MRSPSAGVSTAPVLNRPVDKRSIHSRPSGLSITSTTAGSSRNAAMSGPSAVRSMRAPRVTASALDDAVPILPPASRRHVKLGRTSGTNRRGRNCMKQQDQSGRRSGAKKYRRTAVSTVRPRKVPCRGHRRMGLQQTQKFLERRVVVVAPPIGDIADAGRSVAIANFAEENTRQDVPG
jgi:hypothetical protein